MNVFALIKYIYSVSVQFNVEKQIFQKYISCLNTIICILMIVLIKLTI